jgi:hypothetical protein
MRGGKELATGVVEPGELRCSTTTRPDNSASLANSRLSGPRLSSLHSHGAKWRTVTAVVGNEVIVLSSRIPLRASFAVQPTRVVIWLSLLDDTTIRATFTEVTTGGLPTRIGGKALQNSAAVQTKATGVAQ